MKKVINSLLTLVILSSLFLGCTPLEKPKPKADLKEIYLTDKSGIPKAYGTLVAVTRSALSAQLWFVDEEQTIRKVSLHFAYKQIYDSVLVIPRY